MKIFEVKLTDTQFNKLRAIFEYEECVDIKDTNDEVIKQLFYIVVKERYGMIKDGIDVLDLREEVRITTLR